MRFDAYGYPCFRGDPYFAKADEWSPPTEIVERLADEERTAAMDAEDQQKAETNS